MIIVIAGKRPVALTFLWKTERSRHEVVAAVVVGLNSPRPEPVLVPLHA
jgi:hypothetical protein